MMKLVTEMSVRDIGDWGGDIRELVTGVGSRWTLVTGRGEWGSG